MKKSILFLLLTGSLLSSKAQLGHLFSKKKKDSTTQKTIKPVQTIDNKPVVPVINLKTVDVTKRPADHFMIQYGYDTWLNKPDSVATKGFSRHFNMYAMIDKPFKSDHRYSLAFGGGIGTSNIYFDHRYVDIKANSTKLPFRSGFNADSANFNKFKVTTIYLELPVELRYYSKPQDPMHSWKAAIGAKAGLLLKAYSKGKDLRTKNGLSYYGASYMMKEYDKQFFNGTKLALTGRVGYGIFSLNAEYNVLGVLKTGAGADMNLFQIGLTVSGL
ncbi:MAG: outer membrane beta-barrel protein [Sphingobacteriia bacterium]|nr:outer membrane beta-barrel protein [Sphingobacteriia bacterium]